MSNVYYKLFCIETCTKAIKYIYFINILGRNLFLLGMIYFFKKHFMNNILYYWFYNMCFRGGRMTPSSTDAHMCKLRDPKAEEVTSFSQQYPEKLHICSFYIFPWRFSGWLYNTSFSLHNMRSYYIMQSFLNIV